MMSEHIELVAVIRSGKMRRDNSRRFPTRLARLHTLRRDRHPSIPPNEKTPTTTARVFTSSAATHFGGVTFVPGWFVTGFTFPLVLQLLLKLSSGALR